MIVNVVAYMGVNVMLLHHLLRNCGHICKITIACLVLFTALYAVTAFFSYESLKDFHIEQAQFLDITDFA